MPHCRTCVALHAADVGEVVETASAAAAAGAGGGGSGGGELQQRRRRCTPCVLQWQARTVCSGGHVAAAAVLWQLRSER